MLSRIINAVKCAATAVRDRLEKFAEWQRNGTPPRPMTHETHECANCNHVYEGNYCPRCGQAGGTTRFTFRHAMSKTMEVWGLGDRSMPRTLMHLILRPGYMINDYINGRQTPYFPPVKMLFLVTAANLLVTNIVMPGHHDRIYEEQKMSNVELNEGISTGLDNDEERILVTESINNFTDGINSVLEFFKKNQAFELIFSHSIFALFTMMLFRRSPRNPRLNITECFFAQILIACQLMTLSTLIVCFTGESRWLGTMYNMPFPLLFLVLFYDYKQLYGRHWLRTALNTALLFVGWLAMVVVLVIVYWVASVVITAMGQ